MIINIFQWVNLCPFTDSEINICCPKTKNISLQIEMPEGPNKRCKFLKKLELCLAIWIFMAEIVNVHLANRWFP